MMIFANKRLWSGNSESREYKSKVKYKYLKLYLSIVFEYFQCWQLAASVSDPPTPTPPHMHSNNKS